jgi:hypothetical protein
VKAIQCLIPGRGIRFYPQKVQTGLGAHPASYSMGTHVSVPGDEAAMV